MRKAILALSVGQAVGRGEGLSAEALAKAGRESIISLPAYKST